MSVCRSVAELNSLIAGLPGGERIVFTNGVFDLLHLGHVELLEFAREQGDRLVVGVNDDDSVRRLKGPSRPIFPVAERLEILSAFACVDFVIAFAEDTPLQLIQSISRVDVLVKGGDYTAGNVVGREHVESGGGRLVLFPYREGKSTTSLIERIQNRERRGHGG